MKILLFNFSCKSAHAVSLFGGCLKNMTSAIICNNNVSTNFVVSKNFCLALVIQKSIFYENERVSEQD